MPFGDIDHPSDESLYRTRWLMAHNRLHKIVHGGAADLQKEWDEYLAELKEAAEIASGPA